MEGCESMYTVSFYGWTQVSRLYLPAEKSYYKKKDNFGHAIPYLATRGKIEGCESCTLSHSMDGHRSHVSIFLLKKSYYKKKDNFGHAIP